LANSFTKKTALICLALSPNFVNCSSVKMVLKSVMVKPPSGLIGFHLFSFKIGYLITESFFVSK